MVDLISPVVSEKVSAFESRQCRTGLCDDPQSRRVSLIMVDCMGTCQVLRWSCVHPCPKLFFVGFLRDGPIDVRDLPGLVLYLLAGRVMYARYL